MRRKNFAKQRTGSQSWTHPAQLDIHLKKHLRHYLFPPTFGNADPSASDISTNSTSTTEVQSSSRPNKGLHPGRCMFISHAFISALETQEPYEPQSIQQAQADVMWGNWRATMEEEYQSLIENETWSLVNTPLNRKILRRCKWYGGSSCCRWVGLFSLSKTVRRGCSCRCIFSTSYVDLISLFRSRKSYHRGAAASVSFPPHMLT